MLYCDRQVSPVTKSSSRGGQRIRLWVIHDEEYPERVNSAWDVASYLNGSVQASINACVDAEQVVGQVDWPLAAWHAAHQATNACSIGIEHEGYAHQSRDEWLDPARGQATLHRSARLFRDLGMGVYGIQPNHLTGQALIDCVLSGKGSGYCGHADVTAAFRIYGGHTDPGDNFPYDVWVGWATETAPAPAEEDDMKVQFIRMDGHPEVYQTDEAMTYVVHVQHHIVGRVSALTQRGVTILEPPDKAKTEELVDYTDPAHPAHTGKHVWVVEDGLLTDLLS